MTEFEDIDEMLESTFRPSAKTNGTSVKEEPDAAPRDGDEDLPKDKKKDSSSKRSRSRSRDRKRRSRSRSKGGKSRKHRSKSRSRSRSRSKSKDRRKRRSRSKDKDKEKDRDRKRSRSRDRRRRSRSRDRRRGSRDRRRSRDRRKDSPSPHKFKPFRRGFSPGNREYRIDPKTGVMSLPGGRGAGAENLTPEERDARTVFCMQLSARVRPRDLEEFFSSVGKVRDVKLITDTKTRRSKGIAYVEFHDVDAVPLAMGLAGEKLMGVPIIVQHTQAEKNRAAQANPAATTERQSGPSKLYVGSLHFNITEAMLKGIFEPFGHIESLALITDQDTGRSKGYGFVSFRNADDATKALEQLNGFELAGRAIRVGRVNDHRNEHYPNHHHQNPHGQLDTDETDRTGIQMGATHRLKLMAKLAEGTGMEIPAAAASALNLTQQMTPMPPIATQCFLISNMFDPVQAAASGEATWDADIRDDIIEECTKHGGVLHVFVDKQSPQGNVYVKCPSIPVATSCVNSLHGRWFAGRIITVAYVPLMHYNMLFPEVAAPTTQFLQSRRSGLGGL